MTWKEELSGSSTCLLQADSRAALGAALRMASNRATMNALAAELGLRAAASGITFEGEHYRAVLNFECDALSRLAQGYQTPSSLLNVPRATPPERTKAFFLAWPADLAAGPAETAQLM